MANRSLDMMKSALLTYRVVDLVEVMRALGIFRRKSRKSALQEALLQFLDEKFKDKEPPLRHFNLIMKYSKNVKCRARRAGRAGIVKDVSKNWESPFFDTVAVLYEPTRMNSGSMFTVAIPDKFAPLFTKKNIRNANFEYAIQIRLLPCGRGEDDDFFSTRIYVNSRLFLEEVNPPPFLYLTNVFNFKKNALNHVKLDFPFSNEFVTTSVAIVKRIVPEKLLKSRPLPEVSKTKSLVTETMKFTSELFREVLLICPVLKRRMTYPCRSSSCTHPEVFDALPFLERVQLWPSDTWVCPVCNGPVTYESLEIDKFLKAFAEKDILRITFRRRRRPERFVDHDNNDFSSVTEVIALD